MLMFCEKATKQTKFTIVMNAPTSPLHSPRHPSGPLPEQPLNPDAYVGRSEQENAEADAQVALMAQAGWLQGRREDIPAFSHWVREYYPIPDELAFGLHDQMLLAASRDRDKKSEEESGSLALFRLRYTPEQQVHAVEKAFTDIYGEEAWDLFKRRTDYHVLPVIDTPPLLKLSTQEKEVARPITKGLHKTERTHVGQDMASLIGREEMLEEYGIDGELRGVIHVGDPKEGLRMAVVDTTGAKPHPEHPGAVIFSTKRPELPGRPGLMLVPFKSRLSSRGLKWTSLDPTRAIALNPEEIQELPLDRSVEGNGALEFMFPDDPKIGRVSRWQAALLLEEDGSFSLVNKTPDRGYTQFQYALARRMTGSHHIAVTALHDTRPIPARPSIGGHIY